MKGGLGGSLMAPCDASDLFLYTILYSFWQGMEAFLIGWE